jgi:hypothetical protein
VDAEKPVEMTLALRIPGWSEEFEMTGAKEKDCHMEKGYLYVKGIWNPGDTLQLQFPMQVHVLQADSRVREDAGKLAVMRGPVVYCMEQKDNGDHLELLSIKGNAAFETSVSEELGSKMVMLTTNGKRKKPCKPQDGLYQTWKKPEYETVPIRMIPYYAWANRGEGEMRVWISES